MKSSLRKLRGFSLGKNGSKEKLHSDYCGHHPQQRPLPQLDELAKASQDMQDMQECYDGLISASAVTANSAYEFSEALQEMGTCLLQKTALDIDEDSGKVLIMLGKVQYELHKVLDCYRARISQTITTPSESLLSELRNVEEIKCRCDMKRNEYDHLMREESAKGKSKTGKGEALSSQQLQSAKEEYDKQATFLVCRLMSLKQGQSRSLLTQAARHYMAQLQLFRKGLASLEALEPHVKKIAEQQHIDYQLNELDEDDGEVSFEFTSNDPELDDSTSSEHSMQLDRLDSPPDSVVNPEASQTQASPEKVAEYRHGTARRVMAGSKSAPISPSMYKKFDAVEKMQDILPFASAQRNLHTYALPPPVGAKSVNSTGGANNICVGTRPAGGSGAVGSLWHTSPLEQYKRHNAGAERASAKSDLNLHEAEDNARSSHFSRHGNISKAKPLPEEPNTSTRANPVPLPPVEKMPLVRFDIPVASDSKRIKRYAYSGPLTGKSWSNRPLVPGNGSLAPTQVEPSFKSGPVSRAPKCHVIASPKISPSVSPPNVSPPRVNELYELPKPPTDSTKPSRHSSIIAHSAPLIARSQELSITQKPVLTTSKPASPLPPPPPGLVTRSFSIPSRSQKEQVPQSAKGSDVSLQIPITEEVRSPPLTPIPFPTSKGTASSTKPSGGATQSSEVAIAQVVQLHASSTASDLGQSQSTKSIAHGHIKM
eukprot:Gb_29864 [translate_table: standard]